MDNRVKESIFYHIYPLGFCGAPLKNDYTSEPIPRIEKIHHWVDHIKSLGANAIYFGPIFESETHGYDTVDYQAIDRRLGNHETVANLFRHLHNQDIRIVLDGVFNHVGRDFWAFQDVLKNGRSSKYRHWFGNLNFEQKSPLNDPFRYDSWRGYDHLVKLDLANPEVKEYLFSAVKAWIDLLDIDGLRLDCADCLDFRFMSELSALCKAIRPDFWIIGEVIHGDYARWVNKNMLDSVTNYACYKGLYSSHNDKNYFEIAYSLNQQFGEAAGSYRGLTLYNFADNHDVSRIASALKSPGHLYPLHILLFTMPGIPSIYYGSEWGITGEKTDNDENLRPNLDLLSMRSSNQHQDLAKTISRLAQVRRDHQALTSGQYRQIQVRSEQLAFARLTQQECLIIMVNSSDQPAEMEIEIPWQGNCVSDVLNNHEKYPLKGRTNLKISLDPCWGRILKVEK
jgi:cyclomaltodextrinase